MIRALFLALLLSPAAAQEQQQDPAATPTSPGPAADSTQSGVPASPAPADTSTSPDDTSAADAAAAKKSAEQDESSDDAMDIGTAGEVDDLAGDAADDAGARFTAELDPIGYGSRNKEQQLRYGLKLDGTPAPWFAYAARFRQTVDKTVDRFSGTVIDKRDNRLELGMDVPQVLEKLSLTTYFSWERSRTGGFYDKRAEIHAGLPGPKAHLGFARLSKLDVSYNPLYNYYNHDVQGAPLSIDRSIVHRFGVESDIQLVKNKLTFSLNGAYMYLDPIDRGSSDLEDHRFEGEARLSLSLGRGFEASIEHHFDYDTRQERLFNQPPAETTTSLKLSYKVSFFTKKQDS